MNKTNKKSHQCLNAVLRGELPHFEVRVLAAADNELAVVQEFNVGDLALVAAQSAETRLADNVPDWMMGFTTKRYQ